MRALLQIVAVLLVLAMAGHAQDATPEESLREAERLEKEGSLTKAQEIYHAFLADHADHIRAFDVEYQLAIIADHRGDPDEAIGRFRKVLTRSKGKGAAFKHRGDAYMHLGKLQASLNRHEDAVKTFTEFLAEGAELYEDEAYNLCGGYHAILGQYDKAAAMFNILKRKQSSRFAKEAGYKLAVTWLKAGKIDLATAGAEEFARDNPGHPRTPELFLKIARHYYESGEFRKTAAICEQIRARFAKSPEAAKAIYLTALCSKSSKQFDRAVESLLSIARLYATRDRELSMEALFEAAQIEHKELKQIDRAMDLYGQAASAAKDMKSLRQRKVREYCYFQMAEHTFKEGKWQAALDLYLILQKVSPELDISGRVLQCKSKLSEDGSVALGGGSKAERAFIEEKIKANPGTLVAAQGEIYLADLDLARATGNGRKGIDWVSVDAALASLEKVLGAYPAAVLDQDGLRAYIFNRMGHANGLAAAAGAKSRPADAAARVKKALSDYEKGLALAGDNSYRVEMLENLAKLSHHAGDDRRAFDTYKQLYEITSESGAGDDEEINPFDYVKSMSTLASSDSMIDEVVTILENNLKIAPKSSALARNAMFYLADLYFLKKRYSQAAKVYKAFIKTHGPEQDAQGEVLGHLIKPEQMDEVTARQYDAGARVAHCWFMQGNKSEMLKAYAWITRNQPHANPNLPEAWFYVATALPDNSEIAKEKKARTFWEQLVNRSMDFGSKAYGESFHPWISKGTISARADQYVRTAMLRAGELYSGLKRHETAAKIFTEYLKLGSEIAANANAGEKKLEEDENYRTARYALGRELVALGDYDRLAEVFRAYVDGGRDDRFRVSGLMMLGHYGTRAELFGDAADAYATLLDEFGPPNPKDDDGKPIPVPAENRLRPKSKWDGIRKPQPESLDTGAVRFALGYMFWKKDEYSSCAKTLAPFLDAVPLAENKSRDQALLMLGRSNQKLKDHPHAISALQALMRGYPSFRGGEEAAVDLARSCYKASDWKSLSRTYGDFVKRYPESDRRPFLDLYDALGKLETGDPGGGTSKLRAIAKADTYEDVKADAHFHLGRLLLTESPPQPKPAMIELTESVKLFPRAESLLEAGRCAAMLKDYEQARAILNQVLREFPDAEPDILNRAEKELKSAAAADAKG
jgi:tetratricopeptide (TPR) repeat protein